MAEHAGVTLRPYQPADLADVARIELESFPGEAWTKDMLADWINQRRVQTMMAEVDGEPVGFVIALFGSKRIDIVDIAVLPAVRKQGIARLLMEQMINHPGCELVSLEVRQTNIGAQMFYLKLGFIVTNFVRHFYEDNDEPALRMQYIHSRHTA